MRVMITNFEPAIAQKLRWAFGSAGFAVAGGENLVDRVLEEGNDLAECIVMVGDKDSVRDLASISDFEIPILAILDKPSTAGGWKSWKRGPTIASTRPWHSMN